MYNWKNFWCLLSGYYGCTMSTPSLLKLKLVFIFHKSIPHQFVFHFKINFTTKKIKKKKYNKKLTDTIHGCLNMYHRDDRDSIDILPHLPNMSDLWIPSDSYTWNFPLATMYRYHHFDMVTKHIDSVFHNVFLEWDKMKLIFQLTDFITVQLPSHCLIKPMIVELESSPVYPCAQEQVYCSSDFKLHVPPCWHGDESQAFFSCISHSDAVKPMGHVHVNTGVPSLKLTVHVPPFWHLGPGPVWHGLGYWQNSPTYREEQLKVIINLNQLIFFVDFFFQMVWVACGVKVHIALWDTSMDKFYNFSMKFQLHMNVWCGVFLNCFKWRLSKKLSLDLSSRHDLLNSPTEWLVNRTASAVTVAPLTMTRDQLKAEKYQQQHIYT